VGAAGLRRGWGRVSVGEPLGLGPIAATFVASALATLVNPFGLGVYRSALGVTFDQQVRTLIGEWQSPNFHAPALLAVVVLPVAVTVAYLAFSRRAVPAAELVLSAFLLVSCLDAARFVPYFAIAWCAMAASCPPVEEEQLRPSLVVWPLAAVLGLSFLHGPWYPAGTPGSSVPVRAVAYLEHHPGRIFSTYLWDDYLDWVGRTVFVDGRTELYTDNGMLSQYLALDNVSAAPDPVLRAHGVEYVLWPPASALSVYLEHDARWHTVWHSNQAVVLRYVGPAGHAPVAHATTAQPRIGG
jgi:hypothetical protein